MRNVSAASMLCAIAAMAAVAQEVPRPAPNLEIEMPLGKKLPIQALRGKIVALTFIATT